MNVPNKLTIFRIILVPIMVIIPFFEIKSEIFGIPITYLLIDLVFIIASITDKLDGYLARKNDEVTTFGKFLDPLADKILVLTALIMLVEMLKLPSWIPIIVLAREFIVSGYRLVAVEQGKKVISASKWGKLKTVTQMIAIILAFIDVNGFGACFARKFRHSTIYIKSNCNYNDDIASYCNSIFWYRLFKRCKRIYKIT